MEPLRDIHEDTYETAVLRSPGLWILDIWAPRCIPCRAMMPIVEELALLYKGRVSFGRISVDEEPLLALRLGIQAIPTLVFLSEGVEVDRVVGTECRSSLRKWIEGRIQAVESPA